MKKSLKLLVLGTLVLSLSSCSVKNENKLKIDASEVDENYSVYTVKNNTGSASTLCVYDYNKDKMLEVSDLDSKYEQAFVYGKNLLSVQDSENKKDFMYKINSEMQLEMVDYCSMFNAVLCQEDNYILGYNTEETNIILKKINKGGVEKVFEVGITKDEESISGAINVDKEEVYVCYTNGKDTILDTYDFSGKLTDTDSITNNLLKFKLKYTNNKLFFLEVSLFDYEKNEYVDGNHIYAKTDDIMSAVIECKTKPSDIVHVGESNEYIVIEGVDSYTANCFDEDYTLLNDNDLSTLVSGSYLRSTMLDTRIGLLFDQGEAISIDLKTKEVKHIGL